MAELRLTPAAVQDLEDIWRDTAQRWSVSQAERYIDHLTACFEALAQAPLSAPACDHIRPKSPHPIPPEMPESRIALNHDRLALAPMRCL